MTLPKEFSADQRKVGIMLFLSLDVVTFTHFKHFREWKTTLVKMWWHLECESHSA